MSWWNRNETLKAELARAATALSDATAKLETAQTDLVTRNEELVSAKASLAAFEAAKSAGDDLRRLLFEKAYDAYQQDNERYWKMFNYMTLINGGLLGAIIATSTFSQDPDVRKVVAIVGALLSVIWLGLQNRYAWWTAWWGREVSRLESQLLGSVCPADHALVQRTVLEWVFGLVRWAIPRSPLDLKSRSDNHRNHDLRMGPFHKHELPLEPPGGVSTKKGTVLVPALFVLGWLSIYLR